MVQQYGEGVRLMAEDMGNTPDKVSIANKMRKELIQMKKDNRKKEREKHKRLQGELERQKMHTDIDIWKTITKVKSEINASIKSNKSLQQYNLRQIAAIPDYYEYQNPKNTKQKTNDKKIAWVVSYLADGGTEKQLMDAASSSRITMWKKIKWRRSPADTAATTTTAPAAEKKNVVAGGVG